MPAAANIMSDQEGHLYMKRYQPNLTAYNVIMFSDFLPQDKIPQCIFVWGEDSYFDNEKYIIVIGVKGMIRRYSITNEEEAWSCTKYLHGHEMQHVLSTTWRSYQWGVVGGMKIVCESICKSQKISFRFRKEDDYRYFIERVLPKNHIYMNWEGVQTIVGGICNALEDGRIERIRSNELEGFDRLRRYYRGVDWMNADYDYVEYGKLNAIQKLYILFNQLLFLATCQVYQKGFSSFYSGTPFIDEMGVLMPYIAGAVMAGTCKGMAGNAHKVIESISMLIFEAYVISEKDMMAKKVLEELLKEIAKRFTGNPSSFLDEKDEYTDEGSLNSTFEKSDLVIELDKETLEKLKENTKSEQKGGIKVKVKEEGADRESSEDIKGSEKSDKKDSSTAGSDDPSSDGSEETENGPSDGTEEADKTGDKLRDGDDLSDMGDKEGGKPSAQTSGSDESSEKKGGKQKPQSNHNGSGNRRSGGLTDDQTDYTEQIEEEMRKAAEQNNAEAHETAERKTAGDTYVASFYKKQEVPDKDDPLPEDYAEGMCRFKEVHRKYTVDIPLPQDVMMEGRNLYNKNKRYFKSLSSPNVAFQDSGSVDPGRIVELAYGSTDIFLRKGMDMSFDGCAYILVDNSGSMSGRKRTAACIAAAKIEEAFRGLIPIKIVAFDVWGEVIHEVIKNWNESLRFNCCWNFCQKGRFGSGNEDGYDIMIATKELLARPEQHKLLIVLSDGAPGNCSLVRKAVEDARKKGIQVNGIYFEEDMVNRRSSAMEQMYQRDYVVCPDTEISENLDRIFKKWSRNH